MDALPRSCCESVHHLKFTNHRTEKLTDSIGRFVNLKSMKLRCKMLKALPDFIGQLKYLRDLRIQCHTLTLFDKICMLESIESLRVKCINLEPLPFSSTTLLGTSTASGCENIKEVEPPLVRQSECFSQGSRKSVLKKLTFLELCAKQMTVTPDFSVAPSLETLILTDCEMLTEVHHSIGTLENLEELYIRGCNALEGLPNTICHLTSLERLEFIQTSNCPFKGVKIDYSSLEISGSCLELLTCLSPCRLQSVTSLDIKDDQIEELPDRPLRQMENLEELRLKCKSLKALPKWIGQLKRLRKFEVYSDNPTFFDDICSWENIRILKVRCLEFVPVPSPFGKPENLEELTLECESLKALPKWIGELENLEELALKCKSLKALPKWIGELENLSLLELECSSLETLPDCIASLGGLRTLRISGCKNIKGLPDSMRRLERLISLDLSRTENLEVPPWLGCLTHLTSLKLSDPENDLLLSVLSQLPSLEKLDLSGSNFGCLPSCISNFSRLKVLDVSGCEQLLSIPHLLSPVLEELNVSGCKNLRGLPDFSNSRYLCRLFLGGCNSLESISGFKTIAGNIEMLSLPGPSGVIQCSNLSDDFKSKEFLGASLRCLWEFSMTGNVIGRSHTGQQHLSFLFPDLRCNRNACTFLFLNLGGISSPVHVAVMQGNRVLFETTLAEYELYKKWDGSRTFSFGEGHEIFEYLKGGAATILLSTDVSNLSPAELWANMQDTERITFMEYIP